ncbi:MAG: hypothetical protein R3Y54_13020, partial [Eubacteriales bacterium]
MKKERETKKINYRMRRRIRRTIASMLLITSLVIAAIPVQDVVATTEVPTTFDTSSTRTWITYPDDAEITALITADTASGYPKDGTTATGSTNNGQKSYDIVLQTDTTYKLQDVFEIYLLNGDGVINGFSTSYTPQSGTLVIPTNVVTEYYQFTQTQVTNFFANGMSNNTLLSIGHANLPSNAVDLNKYFGVTITLDDDGNILSSPKTGYYWYSPVYDEATGTNLVSWKWAVTSDDLEAITLLELETEDYQNVYIDLGLAQDEGYEL